MNVFYDKLFSCQIVQEADYIHKQMKTIKGMNEPLKVKDVEIKDIPGYYFHADEDFREDWDWGKQKDTAVKAVSKRVNKFEI